MGRGAPGSGEADDPIEFRTGGSRRTSPRRPCPAGRSWSGAGLGWRLVSPPHLQERPVARVVVDVMPKPEILDPQGKAVAGALPRLGFTGISEVRQGKRFELEVAEVTDEVLAQVHEAAEKLLSNPVIENFTVRVEDQA
ncbi:hypothetical protein GCM10027215_09150 [Nocardioides zeae]